MIQCYSPYITTFLIQYVIYRYNIYYVLFKKKKKNYAKKIINNNFFILDQHIVINKNVLFEDKSMLRNFKVFYMSN